MLVKDVMQAHPVTATLETRLPDLVRLLQRRGFRHLPVVDGGKLVGIISDRDLNVHDSAALATRGRRGTALDEPPRPVDARGVTVGPMFGVRRRPAQAMRKISAVPAPRGTDRWIVRRPTCPFRAGDGCSRPRAGWT